MTKTERPATRAVIDFPLQLGEGPCWSAGEGALYFIDIMAPALFRLDLASNAVRRWPMPRTIGSFGLAADGRIVVALRDGVYLFTPETGALALLASPEPDRPGNRLNDGKVGPDGCFWVGSMDDRPQKEPVAALYRITPDGDIRRVAEGMTISNGLAWSPDGRLMYHADSRGPYVQVFDFDARTGNASRPRRLVTLDEAEGRPDGGACDAEGYYWSAGVSAGCLNRIARDGTIERKVMLPVAAPTMPCFGGPDMKTLFVTSLTRTIDGQARPGGVIAFDVDVPGVPVARFGEPLLS